MSTFLRQFFRGFDYKILISYQWKSGDYVGLRAYSRHIYPEFQIAQIRTLFLRVLKWFLQLLVIALVE